MFIQLLLKFCRRIGITEDLGIVLLSNRILIFASSDSDRVVELLIQPKQELPEMPPRHLPQEVRDGLTTRVHLGEYQRELRVVERGEILDFDEAEETFRRAISMVTNWKSRTIKPRVVIAIPWDRHWVRKRAVLDSVERAGGRQMYLARVGIVTAVGVGLDVFGDQVHGIFVLEQDWAVFAVVSYADELAYRFIPIGSDDLTRPEVASDSRNQLLDEIASALAELRQPQMQRLEESGVYCAGYAADASWVAMLTDQLGIKCYLTDQNPHPAAKGLRKWVLELDNFKQAMSATKDSN